MRNHPQVGVEIKRNSRVNQGSTLPETNMAPENRPSQKETTIPTIHFQVLISFRENIPPQKPTCQCVFHEICLTRRKRPKPLMTDAGKPASKFQKFRLQKKHREHNAQPIHSYIPSYIHPSVHPSLEIAISFKYSKIYMMWSKKFKNHQLSGKQGLWNNFWKHLHHPFQTRSSWDLVLPLGDHTVSPIKSTGAVAKISSAKRPHVERSSTAMWFAGREMLPSYHSTNISWQYPAFPRWNEIYEVMTLWWLFTQSHLVEESRNFIRTHLVTI